MLITRHKSKIWFHNNNNNNNNNTNSPNNFSCSSFKDIHTLFTDDPNYKKGPNIFHRVRRVTAVLRALTSRPGPDPQPKQQQQQQQPEKPDPYPVVQIPGAEKKIVIYFTSLRVIRSTFDDCKAVRSILKSFRVLIDERDVSMDSTFMDELNTILGVLKVKTKLTLPRVFIGGNYIGGAEEIQQLHEAGELKKYIDGLELTPSFGTCETCGGDRFIVCDECSGSHKCYSEKNGFRTCPFCNVNGLIRCPSCY